MSTIPVPAERCPRCGARKPLDGRCVACANYISPLPFGRVPADDTTTIRPPAKDSKP